VIDPDHEIVRRCIQAWLDRHGLKNHICPFGTRAPGELPIANYCKEVCAVIFPDIRIEEVPVCPCTVYGTMNVSKKVREYYNGR